jgi:TolB-like protein
VKSLLAAALLCAATAVPCRAQCPDGSPPPCARAAARPAAAPPNSVAVLYFDNLSRDTTDVFLADGLTDELITRLGQVRRLDVRSRFESQRVRGQRSADPRALGRTLRAEYLVSGSIQQANQRVRVNVTLVRASSGAQAWGSIYDRTGQDILQIQSDIASEVAGAITGQLLPQERATLARRPTRDPAAYDLYLRGIGASNTFTEAGLRAGLDYLQRAIARDSAFADAYVALSVVWGVLADGYIEGRVGYTQTRDLAQRGLRLDSTNVTAVGALAATALALDADTAGARRLAQRALRMDPRGWLARCVLSWVWLMVPGSGDSAAVEARRGWEADTLNAVPAWNYLMTLGALGRANDLAAALPRMGAVLGSEDLRNFDGVVRLARGDAAGAAERLTWSYYGGVLAGDYVRAQLALGRREAAHAVVDSMVARSLTGYYNAFSVSRAYAALGDADQAFAWLDRAWDQRTNWVGFAHAYAEFAPLRADARWGAFFRRMGVTP